jgi:GDPmannose 4,6-dehydratase
MKRAIIVGCNGQDGRILFAQLESLGYSLIGIAREGVRLANATGPERVDIADAAQVQTLLKHFGPDQIYYLAAFHHSSEDAIALDTPALFQASQQVHVTGLVMFLQAMAKVAPRARLFYAASSLVFGDPPNSPQDEQTPLNPRCIYGITKTAGIHACRFYRNTQNLFASVGIFYNHESTYRRPVFVSQKIAHAAAAIALGQDQKLVLGDLGARVDWGWAEDFLLASRQILDLPQADDFVVATGEAHSVQEFAALAFAEVGLDWAKYVQEEPNVLARRRGGLVGDSSRLNARTGWQPKVAFSEMVARMVHAAVEQMQLKAK